MLKINVTAKADRFINSREPKHGRQITGKILALANDPSPADSQRLMGSDKGERRATIGEYRIIYWTDETTLHVTTIGKRNDSQVYRRCKS